MTIDIENQMGHPRSRFAATTTIIFIVIGSTVFAFFFLQFGKCRDCSLFKWLTNFLPACIATGFGLAVVLDLAGWTELRRIGAVFSISLRVVPVERLKV